MTFSSSACGGSESVNEMPPIRPAPPAQARSPQTCWPPARMPPSASSVARESQSRVGWAAYGAGALDGVHDRLHARDGAQRPKADHIGCAVVQHADARGLSGISEGRPRTCGAQAHPARRGSWLSRCAACVPVRESVDPSAGAAAVASCTWAARSFCVRSSTDRHSDTTDRRSLVAKFTSSRPMRRANSSWTGINAHPHGSTADQDGHQELLGLAQCPVRLLNEQPQKHAANHDLVAASVHHLKLLRQL